MAFKTLLVHVENTEKSEARLEATVELASRWSAHLIGLGGSLPSYIGQPFVADIDGETLQIISDLECDDLSRAQARFRRVSGSLGDAAVWQAERTYPDRVTEGFAARADLIVTGCLHGQMATTIDPSVIAVHAGLPMLALPAGLRTVGLAQVVVAWKNSREARRAVTDALPLLRSAKGVHVVEICEQTEDVDPWGSRSAVVARLAAHGVSATSERIVRSERENADELIACAQRREGDLIVAGAYGHSRLREWSLGGMTRGLLDRSPLPVLFSH